MGQLPGAPTGVPLHVVSYQADAGAETIDTIISDAGPIEFTTGIGTARQPCFGDSGGPAYAVVGARSVLVGVVSRARVAGDTSCSLGSVLTRVDAHREWVDSIVAEVRAHGGRGAVRVNGCSSRP